MSGGIEELGSVRWELALCLLASWVFCYFSIWKGVRSSGKVVYVTATFPYIMLLVLLIRGLTLPGAWEGIYFYLYPNLNGLANFEVWIEAGSQICFSYSVAIGTLIVLGSYNEYNNNCYKDCFWLCLLNSGTSFVAGFVVFSVLGFMAQKQGVTVDTVVESGPGLAFIAYPQATAMMPLPQFWTVCFFLMLILLSVDTHFVNVESFITTVTDLFPTLFRAPVRHEIFVLIICVSNFLLHLTLVTEGGIYVFQLIDFYGSTRVCHYFMVICECVAVGWIFGADRLNNIIEDMTGQRPSVFFKLCWKYFIPLLSLISFILYLVDYKHLRINDWYIYPDWAYALGWIMTLSSVLMVPLWAAGQMCVQQQEPMTGNVVGLGNVWRFPYLCYKNGGGAFLVPYGLLAVVCGIPLFLLETSVGQFTQEGFITSWRKLCPLAQGIGFGQLIISFIGFSYVLIEAWALFYLVFSFRSQLPWATCENTWNTANCLGLQTVNSSNVTANQTNTTSAAAEFWERRVLGMSGGIEELGSVRWDLALCLLTCWVFCYFSIWKGVRSSGKVAYFTATFPYVMLLVLLIRGLTLPGAWEGIYYYLYPDLNRLANLEVWIEAGSQLFFSYSLTSGTLNAIASHNHYNNNCYKDCFWLCLLNSGTSFVAGFVVFSVLGFMAQKQGVTVDTVVESGPGLAFIAYPQATAMMPLPQFWTVCFFLMLILLTVDTHFVIVESFITTVTDLFPTLFRAPVRHEIFVLIICVSSFLLHLTLVTEGGIYVFQLIDFYGCTRVCHYFMAVCECVAVGWIFGADRFNNIIEDMTGQRPSVYFKLCWKYFIPLLSLISLILYLVDYKHLRINDWYIYPDWAYTLGWTMTLSSVLMVPLWAAGQMCSTAGIIRQRLSVLCRPVEDPAWQRREMGEEGTTVELRTSAVTT